MLKDYKLKKHLFLRAFSLIEIMLSLIIVSLIFAALTPVVTKKLASSSIVVGTSSSTSEITTDCSAFGNNCSICYKDKCVVCNISSCSDTQYLDTQLCKCINCSSVYGSSCKKCNINKCLKCSNDSYIDGNNCIACPSGSYCDGENKYTSCPDGNFCLNSGEIIPCAEKFTNCHQCTQNACTKCAEQYYLTGSTCTKCSSYCLYCYPDNPSKCMSCYGDLYLNSSGTCTYCRDTIEGCSTCTNSSTCTKCDGGYFLNTNNKCTKCTLSNCKKCQNNTNSQICEECKAGSYKDGTSCKTCSSKFGANCVSCSESNCLSCKLNYYLSEDTTGANSCKDVADSFSCNDSNFMKIGNLCVTRKNMGDSAILKIPNTVAVVNIEETCYGPCCWQGQTAVSYNCSDDAAYGSYGGCKRTTCTPQAAQEICSNFKYGDKNWRLPTLEEAKIMGLYGIGLQNNGLSLCGLSSNLEHQCEPNWWGCPLGQMSACMINRILIQDNGCCQLTGNNFECWFYDNSDTLSKAAHSIRCVADM